MKVKIPLQAPKGIHHLSWFAYRACVRQVGIRHSRQPEPENPFWKTINKKRPRGRPPGGKIWDNLEGWVSE